MVVQASWYGDVSNINVGPIYRIPGNMNQLEYIEILEFILPHAKEEMPFSTRQQPQKLASSILVPDQQD